jgi:hypothetical protein
MLHWLSVYWLWLAVYGGVVFVLFLLLAYAKEWKTPFLGRWISDEFNLVGKVTRVLKLPSEVTEIEIEQPLEPIPGGVLTERQRGLNQRYATRNAYAYIPKGQYCPGLGDLVSLRCMEWQRYINQDTCSIVFGWHGHFGEVPYAGTVRDEAAQREDAP